MRQLMKPEQIMASVLADLDHVEIFQPRKTIGRPKKHIFSTHVKKDALWKPLFRKFRRFIKEYISQQVNLLDMEELSYEARAKIYCHILKVPPSLKCIPKTKHALVLIIESHRVTKRRKLIKFYEEIMGSDLTELKQKFLDFFFENSRQRRIEYFMDPLVRHLWKLFKEDASNQITDYLQEIIQSELGNLKLERFKEDIDFLEKIS